MSTDLTLWSPDSAHVGSIGWAHAGYVLVILEVGLLGRAALGDPDDVMAGRSRGSDSARRE